MELDYKAIGKRIKIARIKKNLTQEAIADKIGITPQHVSNIETGNASVSLTTLVAIANTLTVSVNDLLCDTVLISKAVFEKEAKELVSLLKGINCYVNLIPYNETENIGFKRTKKWKILQFYDILKSNNINVTIRKEFGGNVDAACGQLRAKAKEE